MFADVAGMRVANGRATRWNVKVCVRAGSLLLVGLRVPPKTIRRTPKHGAGSEIDVMCGPMRACML